MRQIMAGSGEMPLSRKVVRAHFDGLISKCQYERPVQNIHFCFAIRCPILIIRPNRSSNLLLSHLDGSAFLTHLLIHSSSQIISDKAFCD